MIVAEPPATRNACVSVARAGKIGSTSEGGGTVRYARFAVWIILVGTLGCETLDAPMGAGGAVAPRPAYNMLSTDDELRLGKQIEAQVAEQTTPAQSTDEIYHYLSILIVDTEGMHRQAQQPPPRSGKYRPLHPARMRAQEPSL